MKSSYDITLAPKVNVVLEVGTPERPSMDETNQLVRLAIEKIKSTPDDTLCPDNLESIHLYQKDVNAVLPMPPKQIFPGAGDVISEALGMLQELSKSGYIPFASPNPSHTEIAIKYDLQRAIEFLTKALNTHKLIYCS